MLVEDLDLGFDPADPVIERIDFDLVLD